MLFVIQTYPLFLLVMTVCGTWIFLAKKRPSIAVFATGMAAAFIAQVITFNAPELSQSANLLRSLLEAMGLLVASASFAAFTKQMVAK